MDCEKYNIKNIVDVSDDDAKCEIRSEATPILLSRMNGIMCVIVMIISNYQQLITSKSDIEPK